jgi:hypothetical protein
MIKMILGSHDSNYYIIFFLFFIYVGKKNTIPGGCSVPKPAWPVFNVGILKLKLTYNKNNILINTVREKHSDNSVQFSCFS